MKLNEQETPHVVLSACMEVHRLLGPGLDDSAYREALRLELRNRELQNKRDQSFSIDFRGVPIDDAVSVDFIIEDILAVQVCSDPRWEKASRFRMRKALTLSGLRLGLIVNFNVAEMRNGIKRIVIRGKSGELPLPRGARPL